MQSYEEIRLTILKQLYSEREDSPSKGWVSIGHLTGTLSNTPFNLVYLRGMKLLEQEGNFIRITPLGIDHVEMAELRQQIATCGALT